MPYNDISFYVVTLVLGALYIVVLVLAAPAFEFVDDAESPLDLGLGTLGTLSYRMPRRSPAVAGQRRYDVAFSRRSILHSTYLRGGLRIWQFHNFAARATRASLSPPPGL